MVVQFASLMKYPIGRFVQQTMQSNAVATDLVVSGRRLNGSEAPNDELKCCFGLMCRVAKRMSN